MVKITKVIKSMHARKGNLLDKVYVLDSIRCQSSTHCGKDVEGIMEPIIFRGTETLSNAQA